jgi:hypothetical protein
VKCHICNTTLSAAETQWNTDHEDWDPCNTCLTIINDLFTDSTEEEIDDELAFELEDDYDYDTEAEETT